jgi:hypothetical protein
MQPLGKIGTCCVLPLSLSRVLIDRKNNQNYRIIRYYYLGLISGGVLILVRRKYIVIIPVSLSIALLLSGCDNSKVAQCDRLMKAVSGGNALIEKNKGQQVTTSLKLAKDLEAVTKSLKQMNLPDPELKKYQDKFVKVFDTLGKQITKAGKALGSAKTAQASQSGREKIQKARTDIDTALTSAATTAKQSDALEAEVKKYCSQPE